MRNLDQNKTKKPMITNIHKMNMMKQKKHTSDEVNFGRTGDTMSTAFPL